MSIKTMSAIWESDRFEGGVLLVLLAMADYANEEHECRPSVAALARKARLSDRQVSRILKQLRTDGVIVAVGQHPTTQGSPIVIYRINMNAFMGDKTTPIATQKGDTVTPIKGDTVTPKNPEVIAKGDICDMLRVTPMSDDPSYDPPIELQEEEGADAPAAAEPAPRVAWYEAEPEPPVTAIQEQATPAPTAKTLTQQPVVSLYRDAFLRFPPKHQMQWLLGQGIDDLRRWCEVLDIWVGRDWSLKNVKGMVDLYRNPERIRELTSYRPPAAATPAAKPVERVAPGWNEWLEELNPTGARSL